MAPTASPNRGHLWATLLVAAVTAIGVLARTVLALPDLVMVYLLLVVLVAVRFGRRPSVLAAALGVAAYDFFFIPPFYTFAVADIRHVLTFAMMFVAGMLIGGLTDRLRQQEAETRAATLKAKAEELRSSLLASVSHDLRTPLAVITGSATALRDDHGEIPEEQRAELVVTICDEAERLERLVGNLLSMTRLESGGLHVRREWVPLEEMVGSALARLERALGKRPIVIALPADLPMVAVDPLLIEQVLVNLLENALRYTPADSAIEIGASANETCFTIEVSDRGHGIAHGDEQRIFERFQRGRDAPSGGVGLGLPICKGIVEAHGGHIGIERRDGGGARFLIELPIEGQAPRVPRDEPEAEVAE